MQKLSPFNEDADAVVRKFVGLVKEKESWNQGKTFFEIVLKAPESISIKTSFTCIYLIVKLVIVNEFEALLQSQIRFDKVNDQGSFIDAQPRWHSLHEAIDVPLQSKTFYSMKWVLRAFDC